ncbi:MAG: glycoside hydrolase family 78 protein [Candidatus Marinimicrobia bacterium]|nr:glycoside hydrolase family 78 protein [Candidatus Neomarinimicrobiota bacterium]
MGEAVAFGSEARWIGAVLSGGAKTGVPASWFRKSFAVPADVRRATLRVAALGLYECEVNGTVVGDLVLAPGWTDYAKRVYVQDHDVTAHLQAGENVIGLVLGDGWYCGHIANNDRQLYGQRPQFLLELTLETAAGRMSRVVSDSSWRVAVGPLLENDLIMGEDYDARLEWPGWSRAGFDDAAWQAAPLAAAPEIALEVSPGPPVRRQEIFEPVNPAALQPRQVGRGCACLLDFGQNMSGRIRLTVRGARGASLKIRHGEMLTANGELYTQNLRSARATDYYTLRGGEPETWEPRFTFHGFRYAEISWDSRAEVVLEKVVALALYSDMPPTGHFACSHPLLNQLASNIHWGLKGNFLDIPTDCPQRDERLGWTGDAQVFIRTATLHRDARGFFHKWLQDMRDAQRANGAIPMIIPNSRSFGDREDGGPAWSDAVYICPWVIYEQYGDTDILAAHYDCMRRHFDYLTQHRVRDLIREHPDIGGWQGFGDWLAQDGSGKTTGGTPHDLIGTAYYAEAARILGESAALLGKTDDAAHYRATRARIVGAFQRRFLTTDGLLFGGTQTAYAMALQFDLLPAALRGAAGAELARLIRANGLRMSTGFVGTPQILHALEATGHLDVAYALLEQTECPSWLFSVKHGATTIWERWDSWTPEKGFDPRGMNSFNHYAYGAVGEWMFSTVAGLALAAPGYARILFKPRPGGSLTSASARLQTPRGEAAIAWTLEGESLRLELTVPPDTGAELSLPDGWTAPAIRLVPGTHEIVAAKRPQ